VGWRAHTTRQLCREQLGVHPCDKRRPLQYYRHRFPAVDFSEVRCEEDELWDAQHRESVAEIRERAVAFLQWLTAQCVPPPSTLAPTFRALPQSSYACPTVNGQPEESEWVRCFALNTSECPQHTPALRMEHSSQSQREMRWGPATVKRARAQRVSFLCDTELCSIQCPPPPVRVQHS
jgi:hypothetical protein